MLTTGCRQDSLDKVVHRVGRVSWGLAGRPTWLAIDTLGWYPCILAIDKPVAIASDFNGRSLTILASLSFGLGIGDQAIDDPIAIRIDGNDWADASLAILTFQDGHLRSICKNHQGIAILVQFGFQNGDRFPILAILTIGTLSWLAGIYIIDKPVAIGADMDARSLASAPF